MCVRVVSPKLDCTLQLLREFKKKSLGPLQRDSDVIVQIGMDVLNSPGDSTTQPRLRTNTSHQPSPNVVSGPTASVPSGK